MFIWLTRKDGRKTFVNNENINEITSLSTSGSLISFREEAGFIMVKETPEEIEVLMEEKARKVIAMHVAANTAAANIVAENEMAGLVDVLRQFPTEHARPPYTEADGYADGSAVWEYYCPACNEYFDESRPNYCPKCGQKIDWAFIEKQEGEA